MVLMRGVMDEIVFRFSGEVELEELRRARVLNPKGPVGSIVSVNCIKHQRTMCLSPSTVYHMQSPKNKAIVN